MTDNAAMKPGPQESGGAPGRAYWSRRHGVTPSLDSDAAARLIASVLTSFEQRDYFQEWFGKNCVDGNSEGKAGSDPAAFVERRTFRDDIWHPASRWRDWDRDALFTAVEFFYDYVSKPTDGYNHDYANCGFHATGFDAAPARTDYRTEVNGILAHFEDGYELVPSGEVVYQAPSGFEQLLDATPPPISGKAYEQRVHAAIKKFRSRSASTDDRRDAVRDLADVLEYLRPEVKKVLTKKDDATIFEIANKFEIRHWDGDQYNDYTRPVWLSWMFYFYLATIHAVAHFVERTQRGETSDEV
jgi:hypothetical protein